MAVAPCMCACVFVFVCARASAWNWTSHLFLRTRAPKVFPRAQASQSPCAITAVKKNQPKPIVSFSCRSFINNKPQRRSCNRPKLLRPPSEARKHRAQKCARKLPSVVCFYFLSFFFFGSLLYITNW